MNRHDTGSDEPGTFRFSRLGKEGVELPASVRATLAKAMTSGPAPDDERVPAGYTYLGQFLDHDLTMDATPAVGLGERVGVEQLVQGRSPALDLDSLYGAGPVADPRFYVDGIRLRTGTSAAATEPDADPAARVELPGADLPRVGDGPTRRDRRAPLIPDHRNDENVAVAQLHAAFIRLHNRVVDRLSATGVPDDQLFEQAREATVRHYQWMVRTDFLPRVVDPDVVADVFAGGRRFFEAAAPDRDGPPTAPIEFTVAAFRFGHSMVRDAYQWNRLTRTGGLQKTQATLKQLFRFTGVCGNLSPTGAPNLPDSGDYERLPSTWVADFRRLFDFTDSGRPDLAARDETGAVELNHGKRVDTRLVDPLAILPSGSFGGRGAVPTPTGVDLNLAYRNLTRAGMVRLGSGQQLAEQLGVAPLTEQQILVGDGHAVDLTAGTLTDPGRAALLRDTPLWFYVLREAELASGDKNGKLAGVGARIVAEVFHRAIEGSRVSIVRDPHWRPWLGPEPGRFLMTDLLLEAFAGQEAMLNPLGD